MKYMWLIPALGLLLSIPILVDGLLPKHRYQLKVREVTAGWESSGRWTGKSVRYIFVVLSDGTGYPVSLEQADFFTEGEAVELSVSRILNAPSYLKRLNNNKGLIPRHGVFSLFFGIPLALAIVSCLGIYYRNRLSALNNCVVFVILLSLGTMVLLLRS